LTVPTDGSEENRQSIIHQGHERIAQEEIPTAQDTILQNDTLQNIDGLNLPTPIDLSLDDDSPNEEDVNNSDEHSDSSSMDDSESNTIQAPIILNEDEVFLRRPEGHECSICQQENHHLNQTALSTFRRNDGSKVCQHVFCHAGLKQIRPINGVLTCPSCRQTGEIVRHDIFPTLNNQQHFQDFLQRDRGHYCTICREVHHLHTTALGTVESEINSQACRHVFCFTGLLQTRQRGDQRCVIDCPSCRQTGYIVHHGRAPQCTKRE
jgi:hypothetical protein